MDPLRQQLTEGLGAAYRIERELSGGMSRVFVATELALGRTVVLKVLPPELARDVSAERFKREISLAASLQHAHIVPLLTAGQVAGVPWFTMPLVEGQSLREKLSGGELPISTAIRLLRDVASALAYAHSRGVVHRDIKPENILLSEGAAFVTDFGVSKAVAEAGAEHGATFTSVGVALGTPAYMAPEQIGAERTMDHRADIYALGVVAYEVLTGRNPFAGRSTQATMMAHMAETPPPLGTQRASTPPALAQLITRCLAKSPADRPQRAQEIVDTLDALTTPIRSTPLATRPMSAISGRSRWLWTGAAVAVLVLGIGAFATWRATRGPDLDARKVAVVPFQNLTGDSALGVVGRVAAEELSRSISQTDSADVVSSTAIDAALGAAGTAATDAVQRVARATRASIVVLGSYSRFGDSLRVQASLVDARNGKVIRALDPTVGTVADPMTAIGALRERLLGSLVSGDVARRVVLGSAPPKYGAYLEYVAGMRMFMKDEQASRQFFERAVALDSTFVLAYGWLAATYTNAGLFDEAEGIADKLEAQRQRLSSYGRLQLELLRALNRYVADEILPLAQELYVRSGDPLYMALSGFWALRVLKPNIALKALQAADSIWFAVGWTGQARDVAIAHHQLGDYRAELAALERGIRAVPARANQYRPTRLRAFAGLRDSASALALADTLLRGQTDPNLMEPASAVLIGARESEAHGDSVTAGRLQFIVLDWLHQHSTQMPTVAREFTTGVVWFDRGNDDSASVHLQRAARVTGNTAVIAAGYLGVTAARRGDSTRARAVADSLGGQTRKWDLGLSTWWRAAILANLGHRDEAMQLLSESRRKGQNMAGWHSHTALRPLRGYPPFEAMIKPQK
jgi:serine/threonine-protein kinase